MTERVEHFENIGQQKKSARYSIFRLTLRTIQNAGWRVIGIAFVLACLAIALDSALPSKPESNIQQSCSVAEQAAGRCVAESISTEATVDNVSGVEDKAQPVQKFLSQKGVLAEATLVPLLFAFFLILGSEYFLVRAFASRQKMSVPPASFKNFFKYLWVCCLRYLRAYLWPIGLLGGIALCAAIGLGPDTTQGVWTSWPILLGFVVVAIAAFMFWRSLLLHSMAPMAALLSQAEPMKFSRTIVRGNVWRYIALILAFVASNMLLVFCLALLAAYIWGALQGAVLVVLELIARFSYYVLIPAFDLSAYRVLRREYLEKQSQV